MDSMPNMGQRSVGKERPPIKKLSRDTIKVLRIHTLWTLHKSALSNNESTKNLEMKVLSFQRRYEIEVK